MLDNVQDQNVGSVWPGPLLSFFIRRNPTSKESTNVTKLISNLLSGYDKKLRPNFGGKNTILYRCFYQLLKAHAIFASFFIPSERKVGGLEPENEFLDTITNGALW